MPTATKRFAAPYREVLSSAPARRLAVVSVLSKIPYNMFPISTVLLLSPRYSYGSAGTAVGVVLFANAVTSPLRGRLSTSRRARLVLAVCVTGYLVGVAGLGFAAVRQLPLAAVFGLAVVVGICTPPVGIQLRARWAAADRGRDRPTGTALESALMDVTLVSSPLLAAWLSVVAPPGFSYVVIGVLMSVAVALLLPVVKDGLPPRPAGPQRRAGGWTTGLAVVFGAQFLYCAGLSAIEVALPIYAQQQHATGYSGWLLAGLSLGSVVGALALGSSRTLARVGTGTLLGVFSAGAAVLAAATTASPAAALLVSPVAGVAVGTAFARFYTTIDALTPPGADGAVQGWAVSVTAVGFSAGTVLGATAADAHGATTAVLLGPAAGVAAIVLTLGARLLRDPNEVEWR
ncbi:MFS transporter [Lentzea sp. JNUCC 0626]|uniref:MFS transporter n=1 Tax=Lentzea sp. JNUCC 0626 TaxID=3367513 RepID=UPI003747D1C7